MLDLARRIKARLLLASTSVYGDPMCILNPRVTAALSIRSGFVLVTTRANASLKPSALITCACMAADASSHLQHLWPAHACDDGRVVSNFIVQALRGQPITLYGDGSQTRSFVMSTI